MDQKQQRRPPTPPKVPPPSLSGDCGDPDYEIIEFPTRPQAQKSSQTPAANKCALCGAENVYARCDTCNGNYCEACDDMNHKHPKRKNHVRRRIVTTGTATKTRPPLPPKGENLSSPPPVPPPRRNRKNAQVGCNLAWSFHPSPSIFLQADDPLGVTTPSIPPFEIQRDLFRDCPTTTGFHRDQRKPSCEDRERLFFWHCSRNRVASLPPSSFALFPVVSIRFGENYSSKLFTFHSNVITL